MDKARRGELKQAYKLAPPPMGIYAVRHRASGRLLLGKSTNLTGALNRHRMELKLGSHRNHALMRDWREYGEAAFVFEVLERIEESTNPDFDYAAELERRLKAWQARLAGDPALCYS